MGLKSKGDILDWEEITPSMIEKLKWLGLEQFIRLYNRKKDRQNDEPKWGDEVEYYLVNLDPSEKRARLSLRGTEILGKLKAIDRDVGDDIVWAPEYAEFMVETTPGKPYDCSVRSLATVESNMQFRRAFLQKHKLLDENDHLMTIPCFPRLGCPDFITPPMDMSVENNPYCESIFFPDAAVCGAFPRYRISARNINMRHGSKVAIYVPIYKDKNTPRPFREDLSVYGVDKEAAEEFLKDDHIYGDAGGCGNGCCCLQMTQQASNLDESRLLYDQLTPITPIMLALSAGTPIYRGYLSDWDSRWNILSQAGDDRTEEERDEGRSSSENAFHVAKSRYCTIDCYVHPSSQAFNDIPLVYHEEHLQKLLDAGIDRPLAQHIAHIFIRDPLRVSREKAPALEKSLRDDSCEYFEDIQSSNWNNMRFKPPPGEDSSIGWRIEFRSMEVQLTDFENAAYCCFVVLLSRAILKFNLSFLIPMSKVDENMRRASKRDAALKEKFFFRSEIESQPQQSDGSDLTEMTMNEIINGKPPSFPGLVPIVQKYLDSTDVSPESRRKMDQYLSLIRGRANGELWTLARFMREFVHRHPAYKEDSVVGEEITYDLMNTLNEISLGRRKCSELHGLRMAPPGQGQEEDIAGGKRSNLGQYARDTGFALIDSEVDRERALSYR